MINFLKPIASVLLYSLFGCSSLSKTETAALQSKPSTIKSEEPVDLLKNLNLSDGFKIEIYADNIPDARSMALSDKGTLFVGNRNEDKVYALQDTNGDNT